LERGLKPLPNELFSNNHKNQFNYELSTFT
jgi:hypothetical protein